MDSIVKQLTDYIQRLQSFYYVFENGKRVELVYHPLRKRWYRRGLGLYTNWSGDMLTRIISELPLNCNVDSEIIQFGELPDLVTDLEIAEFKQIFLANEPQCGLFIARDLSKGVSRWVAMDTTSGKVVCSEFDKRDKCFDFLLGIVLCE